MEPIASALDILQGDYKAYYGLLFTILSAAKLKLNELKKKTPKLCHTLIDVLLDLLQKR